MFIQSDPLKSSRLAVRLIFPMLMSLVTLAGCGTFEVSLEPTGMSESMATDVEESPAATILPLAPVSTSPATIDPYRSEAEASPDPGFYEIAISWSGEMKDVCQGLHINHGGEAGIGLCKTSFREMAPLDDQVDHVVWWRHWLDRFMPFQAAAPSGQIVFQGYGQEEASPAWQRAMAKWAELVWVELETDGRSESWHTALRLNREMPDQPGICQSLRVTVYGLAQAGSAPCTGGEAELQVEGWLETAEWDRFDAWYYNNSPVAGVGLDFYGVGLFEMSDDELGDLQLWAEAIFNRLMLSDLMEPTG